MHYQKTDLRIRARNGVSYTLTFILKILVAKTKNEISFQNYRLFCDLSLKQNAIHGH